MLKISIIGYGKMGRMIERLAREKNYEIVGIVDPGEFGNSICPETVAAADVCMEFTHPSSVLANIDQLARLKKNMIIGTTGWEQHYAHLEAAVNQFGLGALTASNFSLGVHLFIKTVQEAAKQFLPTGCYDVAGIEEHHNKKQDSPSGTAKTIARAISDSLGGTFDVPFSSVRCGSIPGTHTILFDSPFDTISLAHTARNREGFGYGALAAAEWLKGKAGLYTIDDVLFSGEKRWTASMA